MILGAIFLQHWTSRDDLPPVYKPLSALPSGVHTRAGAEDSAWDLPVWFLKALLLFPHPATVSQIWQFPEQKVCNFLCRYRCFTLTIHEAFGFGLFWNWTPNPLSKNLHDLPAWSSVPMTSATAASQK